MHFKTSETNVLCGHNPIGIAASSAKSFRTSSGTVIFVIVVIRGALHVSHICACGAVGCGLPLFRSLAWPRSAHYRLRSTRASKPPDECDSRITPLVTIGLDADVDHHGVGYISPYRFLPTLRPSIDGYPRRRNARSIPSSTTSWILRRSSNAILRSAS